MSDAQLDLEAVNPAQEVLATLDRSRLGRRSRRKGKKLDTSAVAHRLLLETVRASRVLLPLLLESSADGLVLRHPSGRPIEIARAAGSKAGGSLVARWSAGVIFDEAPRMSGSDDAIVNLDDARSAVLGRLLPGAQCLMIGSPWSPLGPVYELTQQFWQKPTDHIVVLRGRGPVLNPVWWTPERCAKLLEQDPVAYQTDIEGEFADPESGLLNPISVRINTRESPRELPPERGKLYAAAIDPSEGTAGGNGWSLCVAERVCAPRVEGCRTAPDRYRVACTREWRGMRPEQCWEQAAAVCDTYGIRQV